MSDKSEEFGVQRLFSLMGAFFVLVLLVAGFFWVFPSVSSQAVDSDDESEDEKRTISVSGNYEISVAPEKVDLVFSVVTESVKAKDSQAKNAEVSQKVISALNSAGIKNDDIETLNYSLNEVSEYNEFSRKYERKGYSTINSLKVSVNNINDAGKIIDVAIGAGVNRVDSVSFGLMDETVKDLKLQALEFASADSLVKAKIMAKGVGVKVLQLESMTENSFFYSPQPYYKSYGIEGAGIAADVPSTQVFGGDIKVSASVQATYSVE